VLNHVCLHQTVIGEEAIKQMEMAGEEPDVIFACCGGGSNFAGLAFPFLRKKIKQEEIPHRRRRTLRLPVADERRIALRFWRHGGNHAAADDVHAGPQVHAAEHPRRRLRYHGMSPMVSHALKLGLIEAEAYHQIRCSRPARCLPAAKASCPRRNRPTPSPP
jgi:tryptophan synthase beta chain